MKARVTVYRIEERWGVITLIPENEKDEAILQVLYEEEMHCGLSSRGGKIEQMDVRIMERKR
ncbi:MAG TPA: hypothetical protein PK619_03550 [bacterium]|nr:hypothetical protein [bacterium]HPN81421.1 hypothetical protein [bacterium]HPW39756.1 hypothetical protein [bacterium]HQA63985.1 hypothetical protein [bacterium]